MMVPGLSIYSTSLTTTGHQKHEQCKPEDATKADHDSKKKCTAEFLKYFSSTMDHPVSQWCRIYQLKDVCICPGETPDELVEHIHSLADQCGIPSNEEKERNIQY